MRIQRSEGLTTPVATGLSMEIPMHCLQAPGLLYNTEVFLKDMYEMVCMILVNYQYIATSLVLMH